MNTDQLTTQVLDHSKDIAALKESSKSAHKRLNENDRITEGIYQLATNVETLATEIRMISESMEKSISRLEGNLKAQGERLGALEKEPGSKWKTLTAQITSILVAAVLAACIARLNF